RLAAAPAAGARAYGPPAAGPPPPCHLRSEYAAPAPSGGGARLGVGTGPPSQRLCAGTPRSPGPAGAAGAAEAERAAPSPRRRPLDFRYAALCRPDLDEPVAGRDRGSGHGPAASPP